MLDPCKVTPFRIDFAKKASSGLVLDCASGTGAFQEFLGNNVISLDLSFSQLQTTANKNRVCGDATSFPFKDNSFDNLWACGLIHYVNKPFKDYYEEWRRVTKANGKIFIVTPNKNSPFNCLHRFFNKKAYNDKKNIVNWYTVSDFKQYGHVYGEIQFLPFLKNLAARFPIIGHMLIIEICVQK